MFNRRTDLAVEAHEIWKESAGDTTELEGVIAREREVEGFRVTRVNITDGRGAAALGKPEGMYSTVELGDYYTRPNPEAFPKAVRTIASEIEPLIGGVSGAALVVGLGNRKITPDAVGPASLEHVMVTRHLLDKMPKAFGHLRGVAALTPGVLGVTGIETAEIIRGVCEKIKPGVIVIVDALASRKLSRLCSTVQIANTGITPGSGVGNSRAALNEETLGAPVISAGAPTVADAVTVALDILADAGVELPDEKTLTGAAGGLVVTPKEIDARVDDLARLIGYGINLALNPSLTVEDVTGFLA